MVKVCLIDIGSQGIHPLGMIELPNLDLQLVLQNCAECQNINSVETFEGVSGISVRM